MCMQVPSELAIVKALLKQERRERVDVPVPGSTFPDDVATIHGAPCNTASGQKHTPIQCSLIPLPIHLAQFVRLSSSLLRGGLGAASSAWSS